MAIGELVPRATAIAKKTQFRNCEISVVDIYLWRDLTPIAGKHKRYASSQLMAKVSLQIENLHDESKQLSWSAYLFNNDPENHYPMTFVDRTSIPEWTGLLEKWETRRVELTAHGGPNLPVGTTAILLIKFTDEKDQAFAWVRSEQTTVYETY